MTNAATSSNPTSLSGIDIDDFYALDDLVSDEDRLLRDTVRRFVDDKFLPVVADHFEAGTFPRELIPQIAQMGLLGLHLDGYGCAGASATAYGIACRELERGDSGLRSFVSVQGSLCMFPIWKYGSEEQKHDWLPGMAAGELIGCFGLTEPDHGSDPGSMTTRARRDGEDWVLNGAKRWITNAGIADLAIVWAQTDEGVRGFVVPTDTKGFDARTIEKKLSLRASVTGEFYLDDVRVPERFRLPEAAGLKGPLSCLSEARYGIVWGAVGAGLACLTAARDYAIGRPQFDRPIAGFQLTQAKLAEMLTTMTNVSLQAHRLGQLKELGRAKPAHVSMAKRFNVRAALDTARTARTILGANGISLEYPVIRHMVNLESVLTYEGTEEIHTLVLGETATGLAAYR